VDSSARANAGMSRKKGFEGTVHTSEEEKEGLVTTPKKKNQQKRGGTAEWTDSNESKTGFVWRSDPGGLEGGGEE